MDTHGVERPALQNMRKTATTRRWCPIQNRPHNLPAPQSVRTYRQRRATNCLTACVRLRHHKCTGKSFERRKPIVEAPSINSARLSPLASTPTRVISNHLHLLSIAARSACPWSVPEVARRWLALYPPKQTDFPPCQLSFAQVWRCREDAIESLSRASGDRPTQRTTAKAASGNGASNAKHCSTKKPSWQRAPMSTSIRFAQGSPAA